MSASTLQLVVSSTVILAACSNPVAGPCLSSDRGASSCHNRALGDRAVLNFPPTRPLLQLPHLPVSSMSRSTSNRLTRLLRCLEVIVNLLLKRLDLGNGGPS